MMGLLKLSGVIMCALTLISFGVCSSEPNTPPKPAAAPTTASQPSADDVTQAGLKHIGSVNPKDAIELTADNGSIKSLKITPAPLRDDWTPATIGDISYHIFVALTLFLAIIYIFTGRFTRDLQRLGLKMESAKFGVAEFKFNAGEEQRAAKLTAEAAFAQYRADEKKAFGDAIEKHELVEKFKLLVDKAVESLGKKPSDIDGFRATIHVLDQLFADTLFQLLSYYPEDVTQSAGRTHSVRFGIVGKCWREQKSIVRAEIPTTELVSFFGMTAEQISLHGSKRSSYACLVLRNRAGQQLGCLYMDATAPGSIVSRAQEQSLTPAQIETIEKTLTAHDATTALSKVVAAVQGPQIRIHDA